MKKYKLQSAEEQCTIVYKRIMGRPLTERYTLVTKYTTSNMFFFIRNLLSAGSVSLLYPFL